MDESIPTEPQPEALQVEAPQPETSKPFDIDRAFKLDEERTLDGAPIELAPGVVVRVARMNNPRYAEKLLKFYRKNKFAIERNLLDNNEADTKLCQVLAETIFVGMDGINYQGAPLPDTVEKRIWALMTYPALREMVVVESQNIANYRAAELEEEGKA